MRFPFVDFNNDESSESWTQNEQQESVPVVPHCIIIEDNAAPSLIEPIGRYWTDAQIEAKINEAIALERQNIYNTLERDFLSRYKVREHLIQQMLTALKSLKNEVLSRILSESKGYAELSCLIAEKIVFSIQDAQIRSNLVKSIANYLAKLSNDANVTIIVNPEVEEELRSLLSSTIEDKNVIISTDPGLSLEEYNMQWDEGSAIRNRNQILSDIELIIQKCF